jgi:hypothetical protein
MKKTMAFMLVALLIQLPVLAAADCVTRAPNCTSYTGPVWFTVITPDRPCNVSCVWGPWIGRASTTYSRFVVRMEKTKQDNVQMTFCAGSEGATVINGPFCQRSSPEWSYPVVTLNWSAR